MSRSRWKSHTKFGRFDSHVYYFSNKKDKRMANRKFRRHIKCLTKLDEGDIVYPIMRELSNTYDFASDGLKHYIERRKEIDDKEWDSFARK